MTDEHVDTFRQARERIVEWRHRVASSIASLEQQRNSDWAAELITYQNALEAIERAIKDEESRARPSSETAGFIPRHPKGII